ncbi:ATP-binding response regulator [Caenispirillum bisanense]|uniref:ATP-binding response regulator n=1 Tax=Caenispirillum bisanense TaxID=414052 RepID=UPI0031E2E626
MTYRRAPWTPVEGHVQEIRILLVEDNPMDARLVQLMLAEEAAAHYWVTHAGSLAAARAAAAAQRPDAVLLDMHLPDSAGLETVETMVAAVPEVPVVVLTGLDDESVGTEAIRAGAQDYVVKGFTDGSMMRRIIAHAIERRRIGVELERAHADLARLNAEKDRFFSIIAHDLKSPFNALLGFSELLLERAPAMPREQILEYVQIIHDSGQTAFDLLENLLEWSRLQLGRVEFRPEPVRLAEVAAKVVALHQLAADTKGIRLQQATGPLAACADPAVVDTILRNLVGNAVKFTHPGGSIRITAEAGGDGAVMLAVSDTGVGMTAEQLAGLFRVDGSHSTPGTRGERGTGLGLMLCAELAVKSGGRIEVDSRPGHGTTFRVILPAAPATEASRPEALSA